MKNCWLDVPNQRPDFSTLAENIGTLLESSVRKVIFTQFCLYTTFNSLKKSLKVVTINLMCSRYNTSQFYAVTIKPFYKLLLICANTNKLASSECNLKKKIQFLF